MAEIKVWWLALEPRYAPYSDLKERGVVAQGWPNLGDLSDIVPLAGADGRKDDFKAAIADRWADVDPSDFYAVAELGEKYEDQPRRAGKALWEFLQIQEGDLVVAIEGIDVKGACQVSGGYWYDSSAHYAQCIGRDLEWCDWRRDTLGPLPSHPQPRLLGASRVRTDRQWILDAWALCQRRRGR